ncbi:right-handed parallel beta-helix repeat-containing protein [Paenibacillus sp. MZ04-78.2]|uniref:right-handed parallel beta-helix repeat-containing protein n=1 Tax=Paenibacillus sp. MZ04-78.2 TaxID=2962034 RepID=UPI0020B8B2FC|nr:NosD domain-containing protein [Paenibacillus sp. MZ04-78.2]MCP3773763.1 right-handed parallel beta-helix repeat-containing protein [Paenibacillus sp. MZ04-78.2]
MSRSLMPRAAALRTALLAFSLAVLPFTAVCAASSGNSGSSGKEIPLQQLIDEAPPGGTLKLAEGTYRGPVVVAKPLRIEGAGGARIVNESDQPAVELRADRSALAGLAIRDTGAKTTAAVLLSGADSTLENLRIETASSGIHLRDASRNKISRTTISWAGPEVKMTEKGNGIDLYASHDNVIAGNTVISMHDAIYIENSNGVRVEQNEVNESRYGVHFMYVNDSSIRSNIGARNITGAMVMNVKRVEVTSNTFVKQSENVNSQGLLLFDASDSVFTDNRLEGNRVGIYVEQAQKNVLERNRVTVNYVGLQLKESENNRFQGNDFQGNVIPAEATDSQNNDVKANYWDNFQGIDLDGDGFSDMPYAINPFFQKMTKKTPPFQLFFQSPGMAFLEGMLTSSKQAWTTDRAPAMKPYAADDDRPPGVFETTGTLVISLLLLGSAVSTIFVTGVRRK